MCNHVAYTWCCVPYEGEIRMHVLSIGEVLWDLFPDGERLGGAPLSVCVHLKRFGDEAILLSAVGDDPRGKLALDRMNQLGLSNRGIGVSLTLPTGVAVIKILADGSHSFEIPRPAAFDDVRITPEIFDAARSGSVDWLYFGTLLQTSSSVEQLTKTIANSSAHLRCFYDMNLREGHWNLDLVQRLAELTSILKTNDSEAELLHHLIHGRDKEFSLRTFCVEWSERYNIDVICITLGGDGCFIYEKGITWSVPGCNITVRDTVGAGDAFSAAFLHAYASNWPVEKAARYANGLGALVASRAGATPDWSIDELERLLAEQPK